MTPTPTKLRRSSILPGLLRNPNIFTDENLDEALAHFDRLLAEFAHEPERATHAMRMARNVITREIANREKRREYWFKRQAEESAREGQAGQVSQ